MDWFGWAFIAFMSAFLLGVGAAAFSLGHRWSDLVVVTVVATGLSGAGVIGGVLPWGYAATAAAMVLFGGTVTAFFVRLRQHRV